LKEIHSFINHNMY